MSNCSPCGGGLEGCRGPAESAPTPPWPMVRGDTDRDPLVSQRPDEPLAVQALPGDGWVDFGQETLPVLVVPGGGPQAGDLGTPVPIEADHEQLANVLAEYAGQGD